MWLALNQPALLGLAIQAESIHLLELKQNKREIAIQAHASRSLPPTHLQAQNAIPHAILDAIKEATPRARHAVLHLSHDLIKIDSMTVPLKLSPHDIEEEITARIESTYPMLKNAIHFDYKREPDLRKKQERIHFVLTRKNHLEQLAQTVQATGLIPHIIDTENHALLRTWRFLLTHNASLHTLHGVLSLSAQNALLLLIKDGKLLFSEETTWHEDIKQLNQFLMLIANTRMQAPLRLLLTGQIRSMQHVLEHRDAFPLTTFELTPLPVHIAHGPIPDLLQQSAFFIAFGLALRAYSHG